jgi:ferredoxin
LIDCKYKLRIRRVGGRTDFEEIFLKGGLATAAGLAACSIPGAAAAAEPDEEKQLATLLDIRKCIGCEACVEACSEVSFEKYPYPQKPFPKMFPSRFPV